MLSKVRKMINQRGYTLMELIITGVILLVFASLAAVKVPNFLMSMKNDEAKQVLIAVWGAQKDFQKENGAYTSLDQTAMNAATNFGVDIPTLKYFKDLHSQDGSTPVCTETVLATIKEKNDKYELYITEDGRIGCNDPTCGSAQCVTMGF